MDFQLIPWVCLYGRNRLEGQINDKDDGAQNQRQGVQELAALAPRTNKGDHVIVMCNSTTENSTMVLKGIYPTTIPSQITNNSKSTNTTNNNVDTIEKTQQSHFDFFYSLKEPLECDRLEEQEMSEVHDEKKIGACLRFKGEHDRALVPQWIEYHRLLGVEHFWVYVNEEWNLSGLFNRSYITYMPFDLNWKDNNHSSYFPHHFNDYKPKLSQEPAQWSCVFNARKYDYDWVITTDTDEYVRVPKLTNKTSGVITSPLQSYLRKFDPRIYSSLVMNSIPFGRNEWLEKPDFPSDPFLIDYVWRRNLNFSEYPIYRYKQIYNPQHVWSIGVHYCFLSEGKHNVPLKAEDGLFIQHYKLAHKGVYKKHEKIMIKSELDLLKDTTLRDMYRSHLADAMERLEVERVSI